MLNYFSNAPLAVLDLWDQHVEAMGWKDERLKVLLLQAIGHQALGEDDKALQLLDSAMALAESGGFIRIFVDEGAPMAQLLSKMKGDDARIQEHIHKLLAAFKKQEDTLASSLIDQHLVEPLSQRELEVLQLIAQGLSNHEIGDRLFLALDTVKGHNRRIYDKLQVQRRTEAVARARELDLL
ncbi:MAG: LuxR C-terminal-related transcriptional regulator [Chloroflexota bacterium]|nr:LuxR C-terminal-related transcriptional regulator [Chloroflexota bacterium]